MEVHGWRSGSHLLLLAASLLTGLGPGLSGQESLEPPSKVRVHREGGIFILTWDLNDFNNDGELNVTFSAFFQKFGRKPSQKWNNVPGCLHITQHFCNLGLKLHSNYSLRVRSELSSSFRWSDRIPFSPIAAEIGSPPDVSVSIIKAMVEVTISDLSRTTPLSDDVDLAYDLRVWEVNSEKRQKLVFSDPVFLLGDFLPDVHYCLKARVADVALKTIGRFSETKCFEIKAAIRSVRMLAIDTTYILKWDWNYELDPNVTFTVQSYTSIRGWKTHNGCENITRTECDVSGLFELATYYFSVTIRDGQGNENFSNSVKFVPTKDTVISSPTSLKVNVTNGALKIMANKPVVLENDSFRVECDPRFHLFSWKNSSSEQEQEYNEKSPFFTVEHVTPSTSYCFKMRVVCALNRTGLYSETHCVTTPADPWLFWKTWGILVIIIAVVIVAVLVYICVCPFQRYIKHIFFPSGKLPSSIEKGIPDSKFFALNNQLLLEEEDVVTDVYIVTSNDLDQSDKYGKTSGETYRDSGNYSNEETTANTELCT